MNTVIGKSEADKQRIHSEHLLEIADDRDRATHADDDGWFRPLFRKRVFGFGQHGRVVGQLDGGRTAMFVELHGAIGGIFERT